MWLGLEAAVGFGCLLACKIVFGHVLAPASVSAKGLLNYNPLVGWMDIDVATPNRATVGQDAIVMMHRGRQIPRG